MMRFSRGTEEALSKERFESMRNDLAQVWLAANRE